MTDEINQAAASMMRIAPTLSRFALSMAVILASAPYGPVFAQTAEPHLVVQLNRLEEIGAGCRVYFLLDNTKGTAFRALKLDLFLLDKEGVAQKRIGVELGPIPEKKTQFKLFDFADLSCPNVGRIVLNQVITCTTASGPREDCLDIIDTSSKTPAPFDK